MIPLSIEAINKAIELNAIAVEFNQQALNWGRLWEQNAEFVEKQIRAAQSSNAGSSGPATLDQLIEHRVASLTAYQNADYAEAYKQLVEKVRSVDNVENQPLSEAVARYAYKLRAYKDEYEVARLYTDGSFTENLASRFTGDYKINVQLAPPLLSRPDPVTGKAKKRNFGPWIFSVFRVLVKMKRLRGTPADIFGWTKERRTERKLIVEYEQMVEKFVAEFDQIDYDTAVQLARLPDEVRGFGHVKMANLEQVEKRRESLLSSLYDRTLASSEVA